MNRRGGAWIAILCILVVGVSVTKMTADFVSYDEMETAAFSNAAGARPEAAEAANGLAAMDEFAVPGNRSAGSGEGSYEAEPAFIFDAAAEESQETVPAAGEAAVAADAVEAGQETGYGAENLAAEEDAVSAAGDSENAGEAVLETVKSPLDPGNKEESQKTFSAVQEYSYEELLGRLEAAETQAQLYRDAADGANPGSVYIAAEQEWKLWDTELNVIYGAIRDKMSEAEAELLKLDEVEWTKERDLEADKGTARSNNQLAQNTDYIRIAQEKTKERCYELVADYKDVLERGEEPETAQAQP